VFTLYIAFFFYLGVWRSQKPTEYDSVEISYESAGITRGKWNSFASILLCRGSTGQKSRTITNIINIRV
jgi:hypothetical protein